MRMSAMLCLSILAACQDQTVANSNHAAREPLHTNAPAWKYQNETDRIRNRSFRLATHVSVQRQGATPAAVIGIQEMHDGIDQVWFKQADGMPSCFSTCSVAYSIDGKRGLWTAENAGDALALNHSPEAIQEILQGKHVTVELESQQYDFDIGGLKWTPPSGGR